MVDRGRTGPAGRPIFSLQGGVYETHPDSFYWPAGPPSAALGLTLRYLGANSLYLSDGRTHLLIDPYFSRPALSMVGLILGGRQLIAPDPARIRSTLEAAAIQEITAIVITHAHYDHALDAVTVAQQLARSQTRSAVIYGSESVVNIARGGGLSESHLAAIAPNRGRQTVTLGDFQLSFLPSRHIRLPLVGVPFTGHIPVPLPQPAPVSAYKAGHVYSLHLVHPLASLFIQGSAGWLLDGALAPRADYLVLPIAGVDLQPARWLQEYWDRIIAPAGAAAVFFSHWDDYHRPLDQPPAWMAGWSGRGPAASLAHFRAWGPARPFDCLPIGQPISICSPR